MHFDILLHERYLFLNELSGVTNFVEAIPISFDLKEIKRF
jgi:hypothetical protein